MTASARTLAVALLAVGVALAGCGGDKEGKPIPVASAAALQTQLDNVEARLDQGSAGACKDILEGPRGPNKEHVQQLIDDMPDSVDSDVKSALQDSFDNLWDRISQECDDKASKQTQTKTTPTETETQTEETTPTETETETETTPTETEPATTPTSPDTAPLPNDGNGNGGVGNGNGNGNGGGAGAEGE
jgi:hypothetical protein